MFLLEPEGLVFTFDSKYGPANPFPFLLRSTAVVMGKPMGEKLGSL